MANKDLWKNPHNAKDELSWWYENTDGISVHIPQSSFLKLSSCGVCCVKISWRALRAALKRKDKQEVADEK